MYAPGRGGVTAPEFPPRFAPATEYLQGNDLGPWTGSSSGPRARRGPGPSSGGQLGTYDGDSGSDPSRAPVQPSIRSAWVGASGESDRGDPAGPAGPPLGYAGGEPRTDGVDSNGGSNASRLGRYFGNPLSTGRPSYWRGGIQGFNDQLQVRDRHAYYDRGTQRTGISRSVPGTPPNNHSDGPARPDLRVVNRSVNPQIGSDNSRNQDDLARPYTWLGQQDGTTSPVYGGVPGLWVPYGTRGGVPYPIQSPVPEGAPADGPAMVWAGPPHGLHSNTVEGGRLVVDRYRHTPQMRPVRLDRPDNSAVAGQSYSQTVQQQGQTGNQDTGTRRGGAGIRFALSGRGWLGA